MPAEFAESTFLLVAKHQRTDLTPYPATNAMPDLTDHMGVSEIGLGFQIVVLKFWRQKQSNSEKSTDAE